MKGGGKSSYFSSVTHESSVRFLHIKAPPTQYHCQGPSLEAATFKTTIIQIPNAYKCKYISNDSPLYILSMRYIIYSVHKGSHALTQCLFSILCFWKILSHTATSINTAAGLWIVLGWNVLSYKVYVCLPVTFIHPALYGQIQYWIHFITHIYELYRRTCIHAQ